MKKIFISLLAGLLLISLSGCAGTKKTVCSVSDNKSFTNSIEITSKNGKMISMKNTETYNIEAYWGVGPEQAELLKEEAEKGLADFNALKGAKATVVLSKAKDEIAIVFTINFKELDYAVYEQSVYNPIESFKPDNLSLTEYTDLVKSWGFTCK